MCVGDEGDLVGPHPASRELDQQSRLALDAEVALLLVVQLRAGARLHESDVTVTVADEQAVHVHGDTVELVGGFDLLPEHLRHDPEHRATVEAEHAVAEDLDLETTDAHDRQYGEVGPTERRVDAVRRQFGPAAEAYLA